MIEVLEERLVTNSHTLFVEVEAETTQVGGVRQHARERLLDFEWMVFIWLVYIWSASG